MPAQIAYFHNLITLEVGGVRVSWSIPKGPTLDRVDGTIYVWTSRFCLVAFSPNEETVQTAPVIN